jgi:integrase
MVKDLINDFFEKKLITAYHTQKSYRANINKYFRLLDKDINTYFSPKKPSEQYEKDLSKAFMLMEKNSIPMLTRKTFFNSVKQFFCSTDKRLKDLEFWETISKRMRGYAPQSEKDVPNAAEIKTVLSHGNTLSRAMFLMQCSMGCRIGELLALHPTDIDTTVSPTTIMINKTYNPREKNHYKNGTKTKTSRVCFMSDEATKAYQEWMKERDAYLVTSAKKSKFDKDLNDKRVFPMSDENAREIWERLVKRSGLYKKDIVTNRLTLHPHCLRAFFRTYLGHADLAEHLMGHASGMDKFYRNMKPEDLAKEFQKYMSNVSIFEVPPDLTGIHEQLRQKEDELQKLKYDLQEQRLARLEQSADFETRIARLEKKPKEKN